MFTTLLLSFILIPASLVVLSDFVLSDEPIAKMAGCGYSLADVKFQTTTMD